MARVTEDKPVAIVTGGGRGIGRGIAARLVADGFAVIVAEIDGESASATARELGATAWQLDVRDRRAVADRMRTLQRIDVLVNNAAIFSDKSFDELTENDFRTTYDVNVVGVFIMAQEAVRLMRPGARIVNIASRDFLGGRRHAHYVASKAAVVGLTRAMAMDLLPQRIFVNAIAPGLIDTPILDALSPERRAELAALQPTGLGTPEDIAQVVSFLASPQTRFMTGQILLVDGGKSLGTGFGI